VTKLFSAVTPENEVQFYNHCEPCTSYTAVLLYLQLVSSLTAAMSVSCQCVAGCVSSPCDSALRTFLTGRFSEVWEFLFFRRPVQCNFEFTCACQALSEVTCDYPRMTGAYLAGRSGLCVIMRSSRRSD
jgi:hypothetical protein